MHDSHTLIAQKIHLTVSAQLYTVQQMNEMSSISSNLAQQLAVVSLFLYI